MQTYLGDCVLHDLLVRHIALVAHEELVDALGGVSVDLLEPLLDVVERVHVGDIVDDADAVSAAVVRRGDGAETLLAGGIPLRFDSCQRAALSLMTWISLSRSSHVTGAGMRPF